MREIKFGTEFFCDTTLPATIPTIRKNCGYTTNGGKVLIFKPGDQASTTDRTAFYVRNGVLYKDEYYQGSTSTLQMTANDVFVKSITFFVEGAQTYDGSNDFGNALDYRQPIVTMLVSGAAVNKVTNNVPVTFNIQSTVSVREIDNR
jgi:hypothetical protein